MSSKIVVLISGGGTNLQAIIDACTESNYPAEIVGVVSNKADAYGLTRAQNSNITAVTLSHKDFASREDYDQALIKEIDCFDADLIVLAGFMRILTPSFVQHFQGKLLNIHPSLLPKFGGKGMYGNHVHKAVIEAQESESGISIHFVNEEYDKGAIFFQAKVSIEKKF